MVSNLKDTISHIIILVLTFNFLREISLFPEGGSRRFRGGVGGIRQPLIWRVIKINLSVESKNKIMLP